jgi:hypothetical protein
MKLTAIGLTTALVLTSTMAFAQSGIGAGESGVRGNSISGGSGATGFSSGSSTRRSNISGGGGLGDNAGGIAEGANSSVNPSGNSFINTSPSGSTLQAGQH